MAYQQLGLPPLDSPMYQAAAVMAQMVAVPPEAGG